MRKNRGIGDGRFVALAQVEGTCHGRKKSQRTYYPRLINCDNRMCVVTKCGFIIDVLLLVDLCGATIHYVELVGKDLKDGKYQCTQLR